jgi:hypothetical protein
MSETRIRYDRGPLTSERREAISHALQAAIHRLQTMKDHIEEPGPITRTDCDELLTQLEDAGHGIAKARDLLE